MLPSLPAWQLDPTLVVGISGSLLIYLWLWRRGASDQRRAPWPWLRLASFVAGEIVLVLALLSPLDGLASLLFAAHMLQHMLVLVVAPPLLLLGLPVKAILRAFPRLVRRLLIRPLARWHGLQRTVALLFQPISVFVLFNGTLGIWHVPAIYALAEQTEFLHIVEHLSFFFAGCLLWWLIVEPLRAWPRGMALSKVVFVALCHLPMLLLGQFYLAFAGVPLYPFAAAAEAAWGLTPLTDQRLGGGVMFGLDMLITFATVSVLFGRYLAVLEHRQLALDALLAQRNARPPLP